MFKSMQRLIQKLILYSNTIKYLKFIQIYYRFFYKSRNIIKKTKCKVDNSKSYTSDKIKLNKGYLFLCKTSYLGNNTFIFLNLKKTFDKIDWNFSGFGKLWTYNLNYFDYLNQPNITKKEGLRLIYDFINSFSNITYGLEPYPISLRTTNWIKYLLKHNINDQNIKSYLYCQYIILYNNIEYHLLGNHLLENGFSLLWGGIYFKDQRFLDKAKEILYGELNEQILKDGGHFELSPMYHQIILYRILDSINLLKVNNIENNLLNYLINKAKKMLRWLDNITFSNGNIPLFNDSANNIAPTSDELFKYATALAIKNIGPLPLSDSGYRKIKKSGYEIIIDVGNIGPDYIPGHAHADTFNFELYIDNKPFIVDTGVSTYEANEIRAYERSTKAHNTVEVNDTSSSEVWGSFRVANRANILELTEKNDYIKASHNGYKKFGIIHTREWEFFKNKIIIKDILNKNANAVFRLHFHPNVTKTDIEKRIVLQSYTINEYNYALGFNKRTKALVLEKKFKKKLTVEIKV